MSFAAFYSCVRLRQITESKVESSLSCIIEIDSGIRQFGIVVLVADIFRYSRQPIRVGGTPFFGVDFLNHVGHLKS